MEIGTTKIKHRILEPLVLCVTISYRTACFNNFRILILMSNTDKNKLKETSESVVNNNLHYSFSTKSISVKLHACKTICLGLFNQRCVLT